MTSPWPGVVPSVDVSLELVARLKVAFGGDALEREIQREVEWGQRRPVHAAAGGLRIVPGKLPGATGPATVWVDGRKGRVFFPRP